MYLFTKSEIIDSVSAQASNFATKKLRQEYGEFPPPKKELSEAKEWEINHNVYLVNQILDQFRWCWIKDPFFQVGEPVSEWKHEISSNVEYSMFNGLAGYKFLSIDHERVDIYLEWYLDAEREYQQSNMLERWIVDMLIYEECRKIAIESVGRLKTSAIHSLPFFLFKEKRKFKKRMAELLPEAIDSYKSLDTSNINWSQTQHALNQAYSAGVEWRHPLPNFVAKLANRREKSDNGLLRSSELSGA